MRSAPALDVAHVHPYDLKDPIDLELLLPAAVRTGLKCAGFVEFGAWMAESLPAFLAPSIRNTELPAAGIRQLSLALARAVWNALPLPRNGFRPDAIAEPGRNDRCPCGSGLKYKHCCLRGERGPALNLREEQLWPWVLEELSRRELEEAARLKCVPLDVLAQHALTLSETGKAKDAIRLLAPFFDPPARFDRAADHAFDVLCTLYDEIDRPKRKTALIERVLSAAPRSALRGAAWSRLAAIRMDQDDAAGAWEAFRHAQRDDGDNPMLSVLEVQLLLAEGRKDEARRRARFWVARFERSGEEEAERLIGLLREIAQEPDRALAGFSLASAGDENRRLLVWLGGLKDRPLPEYRLARSDEAPARGTIEDALRNMGVPQAEIARQVAEFEQKARRVAEAASRSPADSPPLSDHELVAPEAIHALERDWTAVFPLSKPFSVQDDPFDDTDAWAPEELEGWSGFLTTRPESADSVSILDDVATALGQHAAFGNAWFDRECMRPILERAVAILEQALSGSTSPRVAWSIGVNRPALRSLVRLYGLETRAGDESRAAAHAQRLLELNPEDNHGMRTIVINALLKAGHDEGALGVCARFPDDLFPEVAYGRALALFRLKRLEEATVALRQAIMELPKVPRYLLADKIRKPKLHDLGVMPRGDDQAWYYREDMRGTWQQTPQAIAWLGTVQRQVRPRPAAK